MKQNGQLEQRVRWGAAAALLLTAAVAVGCGGGQQEQAARTDAFTGTLTIMAPAAPGGGWDQTAREMQQALRQSGLARTVQVQNVPGAGGTIGLAQLVNFRRDDANLLMATGLIMVGAVLTNNSPVTMAETTPIARLLGEYEMLVVPAESPYRTLEDFVNAWKADPGGQAIAGGSAGGTDHMLAGLLAKEVGIDATRGELRAALGRRRVSGVAAGRARGGRDQRLGRADRVHRVRTIAGARNLGRGARAGLGHSDVRGAGREPDALELALRGGGAGDQRSRTERAGRADGPDAGVERMAGNPREETTGRTCI